ncbi:MAG TPA: glycosyltransferase [Polyangiaceae bacterium]|jgi:UDP:flavonoid glycosyltransferase YjiC (YdhE family)|nr:glycosyltransferase [Polyangiaceae bacterium]
MRVLFSSTRGAGHLQPLLPYAKTLAAMGHEVLVAGPEEIAPALTDAGLDHAPFGHPGDRGLAPLWGRLREVPLAEQPALFVKEIFAGAIARAAFPALLETVQRWRPQLIVRDSMEFAALVAAALTQTPHVRVSVHQAPMEALIDSLVVEPVDALRQAQGLPPDAGAALRAEPVFTSFPESFEGPPNGSAPVYRVAPPPVPPSTGSAGLGWDKDEQGRPLVYITFGTIVIAERQPLYSVAIQAAGGLPVRALLTTGKDFDSSSLGQVPENVQVAAWVPQAQVLPHAALVVCHAGSGTTLGALAAGVPLIAIPFGADQPHNARRLAETGAGLALDNPDVETLRAAMQRVLADQSFRRAAELVAREMSSLNGIEHAAQALLEFGAR